VRGMFCGLAIAALDLGIGGRALPAHSRPSAGAAGRRPRRLRRDGRVRPGTPPTVVSAA
jgi:hypothetical protein